MAETPAVCEHLHYPLQSGSDRVLAAMRRGYSSADFARIVGRIRELWPEKLHLSTDLLVGFPGETWDDYLAYAIERGFDGVFIAADGEECAYLPDCAERSAKITSDAQEMLRDKGQDPKRVKMAAICSVCADPFVNYMREFSNMLMEIGPSHPSGAEAGPG